MIIKSVFQKVNKIFGEFEGDENLKKIPRWKLLLDVVWAHIRYGTNVADYFLYKFYNLKHAARRTYVTQHDYLYLMCCVNNLENFTLFEDKRLFAEKYQRFLGRTVYPLADGEEGYLKWLDTHQSGKYIFKPADGYCGSGIFILEKDSEKLRDYNWLLTCNESLLAEPFIENCEQIRKLNPTTLNTIRVCTLSQKGIPTIVGSYLRMGVADKCTDNLGNGGIVAEIDMVSGVVMTTGVNKKGQRFVFHPDTKEQIVGFKIPMWEETKAMVIDAAKVTPDVIYTAWDVAILPNGPVIIEGNIGGGVEIQQMPRETGKRYIYEQYLPTRPLFYFGYRKVTKAYRELVNKSQKQ